MAGSCHSGASFQFPSPAAAWQHHHGGHGMPAPGPVPDFATGAAAAPPVFCTAAELTLDSWSPVSSPGARSSPQSRVADAGFASAAGMPALPKQQQQQQRMTPGAAVDPAHAWQLQQHNAQLERQCRELQVKLQSAVSGSAASHTSQASPARSTGSTHVPPGGDPDAERFLQRRLAAKAREAEAAAAALAAAQQAVAAREAELEAERARCAELSDELAHCREEVIQRDKELKSANRRLEAAASHAALLDDAAAALRKQGAEAGTALAQRDVAIRGLEERLRALQGVEGSKERRLEALQRDNAALQSQAQALAEQVRRLEGALAEASGQLAELRGRNRELQMAAAHVQGASPAGAAAFHHHAAPSPASFQHGPSDSSPSEHRAGDSLDAAPPPVLSPHPGWAGAGPHAGPGSTEQRRQSSSADPGVAQREAGSLPGWHSHALAPPGFSPGSVHHYGEHPPAAPSLWHQQPHQQPWQLGEGPYHLRCSPSESFERGVFQSFNHQQPAASAAGSAAAQRCPARGHPSGSPSGGSQPPPPYSPPTQQGSQAPPSLRPSEPGAATPQLRRSTRDDSPSCQEPATRPRVSSGGGGDDELSAQLQGTGLGTPGAASPFGTADTLQDMLDRTAALEARLLRLNAERNELEAEAAKMPAHTAGRTLQVRRRRADVERRLEEVAREASGVRLQLRRLGA